MVNYHLVLGFKTFTAPYSVEVQAHKIEFSKILYLKLPIIRLKKVAKSGCLLKRKNN
jgi:hypothetical protein